MARYPSIGMEAVVTDTPVEFLRDLNHVIYKNIVLVSSANDTDNTPVTTLRKGLLLSKITASGKYDEYLDSGTLGQQTAVGLLADEVNMLNNAGTAADKAASMVIHGWVDVDNIHGADDSANYQTDLPHIIWD